MKLSRSSVFRYSLLVLSVLALTASSASAKTVARGVKAWPADKPVSDQVMYQLSQVVGDENVKLDKNIPAPSKEISGNAVATNGLSAVQDMSILQDPFIPNFWMNVTDMQPAGFVTPKNADEVRQVLEVCKKQKIKCVLRSFEGHSYVGQSTTNEEGIIVSMSKMRDVNLTKADGGPKGDEYEVEVGAGISLIEFYTILGGNWKGLGADGPLGFQGGSCPSVGLTGLVSGGGMGLQSNRYGWAADRITAAEVVVFNKTTNAYETVIANYTNHKDLLKALKGGMGGNYGAVTRWWTKVFKAPKVVTYIFNHHNETQADRSVAIPLMQAYMDFSLSPTLDGKTPLANDSLWAQINFGNENTEHVGEEPSKPLAHFIGQCMCDGDDCTDCHKTVNYIKEDVFQTKNNCTGDDYLNDCTIQEMTLAHANWMFGSCADLFPGEDASWDQFEGALEQCFGKLKGPGPISKGKKNALGTNEMPQDHSSLFLSKDITKNKEFFTRALDLIESPYAGTFEIDTVSGAQIRAPTDCGEETCTTVEHRDLGWHIQFNNYWEELTANETAAYKGWMKKAREAMYGLDGSLKTAYQNYLSDLIPRDQWKKAYFPGKTNGKPTYEFLQDIKCQYNAPNTFGQDRTQGWEVEMPAGCLSKA